MEYKFNTSLKHSKGYSPALPNKLKFLKVLKDTITLKGIVVSPIILLSI